MKTALLDYFAERGKGLEESIKTKPGPVVTISREFGCSANDLCQKLIKSLAEKSIHWKHINKEILEETATELHVKPEKLEHFFNPHDKNILEDMLAGLSQGHNLDNAKVHKTVSEVIQSFAFKGNAVIVGRGGVAIAKDIPNSLHIKLIAPIEWRAKNLSERRQIPFEKAKALALDFDHKRDLFIKHLRDQPFDDTIYDLLLNRMTLSDEELIGIISKAMEVKKLI